MSQTQHSAFQSFGLLKSLDDWLFPRLAPVIRMRARVHLLVLAALMLLTVAQVLRVAGGQAGWLEGFGWPFRAEFLALMAYLFYYMFVAVQLATCPAGLSFQRIHRRLRQRDTPCGVCLYPLGTVHSVACPECGVPQERRRLRRYWVQCPRWWRLSFRAWMLRTMRTHPVARQRMRLLSNIDGIAAAILVVSVWVHPIITDMVASRPSSALSLSMLLVMLAHSMIVMLRLAQWSPWRDDPRLRNRPPHWMRDVVIPSREAWLRTQGEFTMARSTSPLLR